MAITTRPTLADIEAARDRLRGHAQVTPIHYSETFSKLAGRPVQLKTENLQRTGAFKVRGAVNKIATLSSEERRAGVVAASAGNHGQAVAWAAREAGIEATIFMPLEAPMAKVDATRNYGAETRLVGERFEEAMAAARDHVEATGATFLHPFEDPVVIAGQGTIGLELAEQVPDAGTVVIPVGGGGLAAGISLALRAVLPDVRIVGVQAGKSGYTIADGIFVKAPGELTMRILDETLDDLVEVTDEQISEAIVLLLERAKLVVEGAGAVGVAALLAGRVSGEGPAAITVMRHGLTLAGRYLVVRTRVPDRPGELVKLLEHVAAERVNVVSVEHHREGMAVSVVETEVELTLGTRDEEHAATLLGRMRDWGYAVERLR